MALEDKNIKSSDLTPTYLLTPNDFDKKPLLKRFSQLLQNDGKFIAWYLQLRRGIREDRLISNSSPFVRPQEFVNTSPRRFKRFFHGITGWEFSLSFCLWADLLSLLSCITGSILLHYHSRSVHPLSLKTVRQVYLKASIICSIVVHGL